MLCAAESPARSVIASVHLAMERASSEPLGPASTVRYRFLSSSRMRGAGSPPPCEGESPPNFSNCPLSSKDSGGERAWRPAPSNSLHACYTQVSLHALYCLYTLCTVFTRLLHASVTFTRLLHACYTLVTRLLHACYTLVTRNLLHALPLSLVVTHEGGRKSPALRS